MENPFEFNGFSLTLLHPTLLPNVFQYIELGLIEVQRKSRIDWDVMVIPTMISTNQATLTMMHHQRDGQEMYAGFVVTKSEFLGIPPKHYLKIIASFVELWVSQEGSDGVAAIDAFVMEFAKDLKCKHIIEISPRPAMVRRLEKLGYHIIETTMIKHVEA